MTDTKEAMSNSPSNHDHDVPPVSSTVDGSSGSGAEDLVQSVLADARELLETFGNDGRASETTASDPVPAADGDAFDPAAVEAVLVVQLLKDF